MEEDKRNMLNELAEKWEESGILDGLLAADPNSTVFDVFKDSRQLEIVRLKKELEDKKKMNRDLWNSYGSELCAGDMIEQENRIESKIRKLETMVKLDNAGLLDENDEPIPSKPDLEEIKKLKNGMDN